MSLAPCNIPLLERQKGWVAEQLVRVLWAEGERKLGGRGWGGEGEAVRQGHKECRRG